MNNGCNCGSGGMIPFEPLNILVTEADRTGQDISKMSDFMGLYAQKMTRSLAKESAVEMLCNIPVANIGILSDVIQQACVIARGNVTLIPDFDNLPHEIKEKLKKGIYSIGESRQVDGNLRAVIIDENKDRIKDITLKKVISNPGALETTRNISNQMQMKQIQDTLVAIQEMQSYQIDRDRDTAILTPFFDAREFILQAQNAETLEQRNRLLDFAASRLTTALNGVYTDMKTSANHLAENTKHILFHKQSTIDALMQNLSDDLQLATKFSGIQMQIFDTLGRQMDSQGVLKRYESIMLDFVTLKLSDKGLTAAELLHDNFHYTKENIDCWLTFSREIRPALEKTHEQIDDRRVYIVTMEDKIQ